VTIEEIRHILSDISPYPWFRRNGSYFDSIFSKNGALVVSAEIDTVNADFIARAPEYIEFLLREISLLESEIDQKRS
jgi:hypothetical protein